MKAREYNSPLIQELINETTSEEMDKIDNEMKQKTAVEWLIEQIESGKIEIVYSNKIHSIKCIPEIIEQAKALEEAQHKETFKQSRQAKIFEKDMPPVWESFEQYYNETYGGNK